MTHTLPQAALAYPTCKALKDVGYPQTDPYRGALWGYNPELSLQDWTDGQPAFYLSAWELGKLHGADGYRFLAGTQFYACPNSDELLAAIRERWPAYAVSVTWFDDGAIAVWNKDGGDSEKTEDGDTPAVALAALYIALAGGQPCS